MNGQTVLAEIIQAAVFQHDAPSDGISAYQEMLNVGTRGSLEETGPTQPRAFENVQHLPIAHLREVLRHIPDSDVCKALYCADPQVLEYLLSALPFRRRIFVRSRLAAPPLVRLGEVAEAQESILAMAQHVTPITMLSPARQAAAEAVHA